MKLQASLVLALVLALAGAWWHIDSQYFRQAAAQELEARLLLAQAETTQEIQADIEALRLANVIAELEAIQRRSEARQGLPGDETRRRQLVSQMNRIIEKLEK